MKVMIDPNLAHHRKVRKLAALLKISHQTAVGHLVSLWCEVMLQRESGDLLDWDGCDIAMAAGWPNDQGDFLKALKVSKFLDWKGDKYAIHEWTYHQGDLIQKREQWRDRQKKMRDKLKKERESRVSHTDVTHGHASPYPPVPSPSLPVPVPSHATTTPTAHTHDQHSAETEPATPALRSGSTAALLAASYLRMNPGVIGQRKATEIVEFCLARGAKASDLEEAISDTARCKGYKIWEVLDPLAPVHKNGQSVNWLDEARKKFLGERSLLDDAK